MASHMIAVALIAGGLLLPAWAQDEIEVSPEVTESAPVAEPEIEASGETPGEESSIRPAPSESTETAAPEPARGTILLSDNFDDPASGLLPRSSDQPTAYQLAYVGGEYQVRMLVLGPDRTAKAYVPGTYIDASVAVDTRLVGDLPERGIVLACRSQPQLGEYRFVVEPESRHFWLIRAIPRLDGSGRVGEGILASGPSSAINRGNANNRVELMCTGDTITGIVNGVVVGSAKEGSDVLGPPGTEPRREGRIWVGVWVRQRTNVTTAEARFDNLAIIQL